MIVIADYRKNMVDLFRNREKFEDMFRPRVIIPAFNQDDLFDYVDYKIIAVYHFKIQSSPCSIARRNSS